VCGQGLCGYAPAGLIQKKTRKKLKNQRNLNRNPKALCGYPPASLKENKNKKYKSKIKI
jgi:hypothetical protein